MSLNIIGIWASDDSSSCCLLQDGVVRFTAQEKSFCENGSQKFIPVKAFHYCLDSADISITDIDCIVLCKEPEKVLETQIFKNVHRMRNKENHPFKPRLTVDKIKSFFGYNGFVTSVEHQMAHAAFSYYSSDFDEAAIMVIDTAGPWTLTFYAYGNGKEIGMFEHDTNLSAVSIMLYLIMDYLGFRKENEWYKVKLLAKGGKPVYSAKIKEFMQYLEKEKIYIYQSGAEMNEICKKYSERLTEILQIPASNAVGCVTQIHRDVARSMQLIFEELVLERAKYIYERTNLRNICIAGNLVIDSVVNMKVLEKLPFENVFVHRACDDNTCAIGAAMEEYLEQTKRLKPLKTIDNLFLGIEYSQEQIGHVLRAADMEYEDYYGREDLLLSFITDMLIEGKVVGWFQGRNGIGSVYPYTRLILADPRKQDLYGDICCALKSNDGLIPIYYTMLDNKLDKNYLNKVNCQTVTEDIKTSMTEKLTEFNHMGHLIENMLLVNLQEAPLLYKLIQNFYKSTGFPMLANTPLRLRNGENVLSLLEAIEMFITSKIDLLVIGNFVLDREKNMKPFISWLRIQFINL